MSNVYANGMEISAKKDANKSICAMPDVCLSPPSPPAGPLPLPYPNTSDASKTADGSKSVKIGGQEVGLKNESNYKSSSGDEAATRGLGMGVVTHTIQGKTKHAAWSFDVKIEGANAIRHMDITTHNHINQPNIALTMNAAGIATAFPGELSCAQLETVNQGDRQNNLAQPVGGVTTTAASYTQPGGGAYSLMQGTTPMAARLPNRNAGQVPGRPANQTYPCTNAQMQQNANNHTESKIINQIVQQAGNPRPASLGFLRMNITHQRAGRNPDRWVCLSCRRVICDALACGLDIELCEDGQTVTTAQVQQRCATGQGWPPQA